MVQTLITSSLFDGNLLVMCGHLLLIRYCIDLLEPYWTNIQFLFLILNSAFWSGLSLYAGRSLLAYAISDPNVLPYASTSHILLVVLMGLRQHYMSRMLDTGIPFITENLQVPISQLP